MELSFQATHVPDFQLSNGWTPPPATTPDLPFSVRRSGNEHLPVYTTYKNANTRVMTVLRNIDGDVEVIATELP